MEFATRVKEDVSGYVMGILSGISWFVGVVKASKVFKAIKIIGAIVTLAVGKRFFTSKTNLAKVRHTCKQNVSQRWQHQ